MCNVFLPKVSVLGAILNGRCQCYWRRDGKTYLIIPIRLPSRVLAQNLHDTSPALDPDAGSSLAALRIVQPRLELVCSHVDLFIEELEDLCVGFAHRDVV